MAWPVYKRTEVLNPCGLRCFRADRRENVLLGCDFGPLLFLSRELDPIGWTGSATIKWTPARSVFTKADGPSIPFPQSFLFHRLAVEDLRRCPVAQCLMRPPLVVESEISRSPGGPQGHWRRLSGRPPRTTPSATAAPRRCCPGTCPFPSMLTRTPRFLRTWVNSRLVNWLPWSVLNTSGRPWAKASSSTSAQKCFQGVGQPPGQHVPAVPVHDRQQANK